MKDVPTGAAPIRADRPVVFRSVAMSWEDLVVARAVLQATGDLPEPE